MIEKHNIVILANGLFPSGQQCIEILEGAEKIICCDGAADKLSAFGLLPHAIIGDLDSLSGEARSCWEDKIVISIACHNAIRSGQSLTDDEMRELVRQLEQTASPHTCPHGRPTIIHLSTRQLEKEFGRS